MSEKLTSRHESKNTTTTQESGLNHETQRKTHEKARQARHEHQDNVEKIRKDIERHSDSQRESDEVLKTATKSEQEENKNSYVGKDLLEESFRRTMVRTRHRLSPPMRAFSRVVHHPVIDSISEVTSKTVARPSGILAGGISALIGSSIILWVTKHYGYEYNFLLFALLFVAGFFVGLLIEAIVKLIVLRRR